MKFLCSHCGHLDQPGRFSADGEELTLTCLRCGKPTFHSPAPLEQQRSQRTPLPQNARVTLVSSEMASNVVSIADLSVRAVASAKASIPTAFEVPEGHCPKCLQTISASPICGRCGATRDRVDMEALAPPQWLAKSWRDLLQEWGDGAAHKRILSSAGSEGALASLGRLYRLRLLHCPEDPWAQRAIGEIIDTASMSALRETASVPPTSFGWIKGAVALFTLGVCAIAIFYMLRFLRAQ